MLVVESASTAATSLTIVEPVGIQGADLLIAGGGRWPPI
jgi:hypothetical protein